ncbi:MAG TPA: acyclic terpene utilization AtuA family protein [Nitriliruptoraceae bacterium]|nr:acyclic terpene utilization AtuA family protein [Nitriliruptoraceae bacterium]
MTDETGHSVTSDADSATWRGDSAPTPPRSVTVAGAAGMWGDSALATRQLLDDGRADYVVYEALAEVTMAILARARAKDPDQGYARDIVTTIASHLDDWARGGTKVVTNAGGVNPAGAAAVVRAAVAETGLDLAVATVTGDDLGGRLANLSDRAAPPPDAGETAHPAAGLVPADALAAHAYLGARPIADALSAGADIVITGRVVDSALTLGPLVHEFGWDWDDHDKLSAGSLAGHLVECGPQTTGGLLTDWEDTASWVNPGYPLATVRPDGHVTITTATESDGLVDERTVTEQLLYEIGDPRAYLLPDVTCDWSEVTVTAVAPDEVAVTGARGGPPPSTLKGFAHVPDGFRTTFLLFVGGRDAVAKARRIGSDLLARGQRVLDEFGLPDFLATSIEVLGSEATYGAHGRRGDSREVVLALGVAHAHRMALAGFVREVPSIGLAGPPGVSGGGSGLPRVTPVLRLVTFPVPRAVLDVRVEVDGVPVDSVTVEGIVAGEVAGTSSPAGAESDRTTTGERGVATAAAAGSPPVAPTPAATPIQAGVAAEAAAATDHDTATVVPLVALAHGRSGDKGADVNIGIRVRHPDFLPVLAALTGDVVAEWLAHLGASSIERFDLPGIDAVNFLMHDGLGDGGVASLRFDPQGKAVAQQLLDIPVRVPAAWRQHPAFRHP